MTGKNWLTPETAIGARLPCGATVVLAEWSKRRSDCVWCMFDDYQENHFHSDGRWEFRPETGNLIPPSQPAEPAHTEEQILQAAREAAARAYDALVRRGDARVIRDGAYDPAPAVQSALIMAREGVAALLPKPQPEPWRAAYEAWASEQGHGSVAIEPWRAGWEAAKREGGE
jgi:hypothetical protein